MPLMVRQQEIGPAPGQFLLSLVAFNLGVELGQLAVIALCFLVFGWTARQRWHRPAVVVPASFVIAPDSRAIELRTTIRRWTSCSGPPRYSTCSAHP